MSKIDSSKGDVANPEIFKWTLNQVTRTADDCLSEVVDNRIQIIGVQYNTGENNHLIRLDVPNGNVSDVNIVRFGQGADRAHGTRYNGSSITTFTAGYIGYIVRADRSVEGVFTGILDLAFPPLIVGVFDVENDTASTVDLLDKFDSEDPEDLEVSTKDQARQGPSVCVISTPHAGFVHTQDANIRYADEVLTVVANFANREGPTADAVEKVTFTINGVKSPSSAHVALPDVTAKVEYYLKGQKLHGEGRIEALTYNRDQSAWSGEFTFNAFRGFFTIHPDA